MSRMPHVLVGAERFARRARCPERLTGAQNRSGWGRSRGSVRGRRWWLALLIVVAGTAFSGESWAQYRGNQFGFEAGYSFLGKKAGLDSHGFLVGLRGAFKTTDHWWFSGRALVSFRGEQDFSNNTVVLLHVVPVDARYYLQTDYFRPFVGVTNSFQFLFNQTIDTNVLWGPGVTGGLEIRLKRDTFLAFQLDAYWMFVFEGPDAPLLTATSQLIFFL